MLRIFLPVIALVLFVPGRACCQQAGSDGESVAAPQAAGPLRLTSVPQASPLAEQALSAVQATFSIELPRSYQQFLSQHNGAFVSPACVVFEEDGHQTVSDVFCFLAVGDDRPWVSLEWQQECFRGRLPEQVLPIARDSCGNLWVMSVRRENTGAFFFWDPGTWESVDETDLDSWPQVASSFHEFLQQLRPWDEALETSPVLSRRALVQQAVGNMQQRDPMFSMRANPAFVWHFDCDDAGRLKLALIKHEVHAMVTHTCGYHRLRAVQGLIDPGPPRLPR